MTRRIPFAKFLVLLTLASIVQFVSARADEPVSFRKQIAPMLLDQCVACHGPKKAEGGFRVDSFERVTAAGDSGAKGFEPKNLDASEVFRRIVATDEAERMPAESDPLSVETIALVKRWIEEGAVFDGTDAKADLVTIIPPPMHPDPPEAYKMPVPVTALAFSADGNELYAGGYHEITVWNPADGKLVRRLKNVGQRTYALRVSPDGKTLAAGCGAPGRHGETRLFDLASGNLVNVFGSSPDVVLDVAFSPQGDRLATAAADGMIRVFEVASAKELFAISSHSDWVTAVAWNADGTKLASGSRDKTSKVFDAKNGELLITYSAHSQPVKGVAFHPDGAEVYSAGADNKIHRWKIADAGKTAEVAFGGEVYKLQVQDEFLFATSADKTVRQFNAKSHQQVRSLAGHKDWALCSTFHPVTKRLASGGFDGEVKIWNAEDGKDLLTFVAAPGAAPK